MVRRSRGSWPFWSLLLSVVLTSWTLRGDLPSSTLRLSRGRSPIGRALTAVASPVQNQASDVPDESAVAHLPTKMSRAVREPECLSLGASGLRRATLRAPSLSCPTSIDATYIVLLGTPGIYEIEVHLPETLRVVYDPTQITAEAIVAAISALYPSQVMGEGHIGKCALTKESLLWNREFAPASAYCPLDTIITGINSQTCKPWGNACVVT